MTLDIDMDGARNAARILEEMTRAGHTRRASLREGEQIAREAHV